MKGTRKKNQRKLAREAVKAAHGMLQSRVSIARTLISERSKEDKKREEHLQINSEKKKKEAD